MAALKPLEHKRRVKRYFNRKVNPRTFVQGDLVLKRRLLAGSNLGVPKLEPNWEGPYILREVAGLNAYFLITFEGIQLPRTWSRDGLKKFYAKSLAAIHPYTPYTRFVCTDLFENLFTQIQSNEFWDIVY
ncbi:hypothetical protein AXF42_Ash010297 [Apostasia shenzhenica]|uniref:Uncharacterized protein n=1 Tax=Apostasia shenzhenica TaxID=1088818 RepID=A0A2I0BDN1_9ASPA|nr:hypothetical protein AXF42_Ash010297 [Apostasia shenzhenica]